MVVFDYLVDPYSNAHVQQDDSTVDLEVDNTGVLVEDGDMMADIDGLPEWYDDTELAMALAVAAVALQWLEAANME